MSNQTNEVVVKVFNKALQVGVALAFVLGAGRYVEAVAGQPRGANRAQKSKSKWVVVESERSVPAAPDQYWPLVRGGHYVMWVGRAWNTRKPSRIWQSGKVGTLGQHNGTGTYLGEQRVNSGTVDLDVKFDAGYLAPEGGGKHLMEIMSWMADRGDRKAIRARPSSRIELANLGDRTRCLVWNYGPHFRGQATKISKIGPAFEPDRWYHIRFDWSYGQECPCYIFNLQRSG